jgi:hypothetical protein
MKHAIIYVPGLGDHRSRGQQFIMKAWRIYGLHTEVVNMNWHTSEMFNSKLDRLLLRIDTLAEQGYAVSLIGVSAGASAVINAYTVRQDKIHRVVCICGKLRSAESVSSYTYRVNPGFGESLQHLPESLFGLNSDKRVHILSIRPTADELVPPSDTIIPGAISKVIPTRGHAISIGFSITVYSWAIIRFIKQT